MKVVEFLEKHRSMLSLNGIEDKFKIPKDSLRFYIGDKKRSMPYKHEVKIANWFGLDLPTQKEPHTPISHYITSDLNDDGSFNMDVWDNLVLYVENPSGIRSKYRKDGNKLFPK